MKLLFQRIKIFILFLSFFFIVNLSLAQVVKPGAERPELYLYMLSEKKVGVVANQSSIVGEEHLVDFLLKQNVAIKTIFSPEHGFRGKAGAGVTVADGIDEKTGLSVISLYGKNKKPKQSQIKGLDLIVFDLQDVGVRFYTYISTLTYMIEACAEANIPIIILDRPNPNAHYVDGPLLKEGFESFVGMHQVPVVYGMTIGEYGLMINGEKWISPCYKSTEMLTVIPVENYSHTTVYKLAIAPSPNLQNMSAVWLYPTLCFFEGTVASVGRGTKNPFELIAHPNILNGDTIVVPVSIAGVAENPKLKNEKCNAYNFINKGYEKRDNPSEYKLDINLIISIYKELNMNADFFTPFFDKLAGTEELRKQIVAGYSEEQIRNSWQTEIQEFMKIRKKYLIYK